MRRPIASLALLLLCALVAAGGAPTLASAVPDGASGADRHGIIDRFPDRGGGSGAGDPWPGRVSVNPRPAPIVNSAEIAPGSSQALRVEGGLVVAWSAGEREAGVVHFALAREEGLFAAGAAPKPPLAGLSDVEVRLLGAEGRTPLLAWLRVRGDERVLMLAPLDPRRGQLGAPRPLVQLDPQVREIALALDPRGRVVLALAEEAGGAEQLWLLDERGRRWLVGSALERRPGSLRFVATASAALALEWSEAAGLVARASVDEAGQPGRVRLEAPLEPRAAEPRTPARHKGAGARSPR